MPSETEVFEEPTKLLRIWLSFNTNTNTSTSMDVYIPKEEMQKVIDAIKAKEWYGFYTEDSDFTNNKPRMFCDLSLVYRYNWY